MLESLCNEYAVERVPMQMREAGQMDKRGLFKRQVCNLVGLALLWQV